MTRNKHKIIRRSHRYLGLLLGIQFLVWTISGLYFSWTNINEIHGDFQHKHPPRLTGHLNLVSPGTALQKLNEKVDSFQSLQLLSVLNKPCYSIQFYSGGKLKKVLADATTGDVRPPVSKEEAVQIAAESFNGQPNVKSVEYITVSNGHHEYRQKPLPAWAVTFNHPTNTTVYVSAEEGRVESFRINKWRIFDFLWMGHTMGYQDRDDINNWLLRIFSIFGLVTILSGFALFWVSRRKRRHRRMVETV